MFELILVALGVLILVAVHRRNTEYERRLRELEERVRQMAVPPVPGPAITSAPVVHPSPTFADAVSLPDPAQPPAPASAKTEGAEPVAAPSASAETPPPAAPPPAPPAPPQGRSLEETIGSRWAVWVGGLALGLGGIFLVRYSIEQGLLGPGVRVTLGLLFALALLAAGEWLRRREEPIVVAAFAKANIPAVLTAAGTSTAFASIYAAYALHGFVGPTVAFGALGLVALVTMAAALLHGPGLAGLGLVAALASPLLVETRDPSPLALVLYLAFAVGAAYGVARIRRWRWLAITAATGALLWVFPFLFGGAAWQAGLVAHLLLQLALALLFLVVDPYRETAPEEAETDRMVTIVLFCFALLAIVAGEELGAGLGRPLFVGAVVVMLSATAILYPAAAGALLIAGFTAAGTLFIWPILREASREPERVIPDLPSAPYPEALSTFIGTAVVLAGIVAVAGLVRLAYGQRLRLGAVAWYAAAVTLTPLGILVVAYWRIVSFDHSIPFALVAGSLALAFAAATAWLRRHDPDLDSPALRLAVGAVASAAIASLAAGLTFALDRGILTIALAFSALGTAVIAEKVRVPALRWTVGALGVAVAARLAWDPSVMRGEIGATPIFNWLLWGYGAPAVAFLLAARILSRQGRDWVVRFVESLGYVFAALLVFLEIRHALYGGDPFAMRSSHLEAGLVVTEALAFTLLMLRLDLTRPDSLYRYASIGLGALAIASSAVSLGLGYNPYFNGERVIGGALFNSLMPAYLLPAGMAAAVAWIARPIRPRQFVLAAAGLVVGLLLAYLLLEIRRLFHPDGLIGILRPTSQAELWCYSLALLASGLGLLAFGLTRGSEIARRAALGCLVAAVLKVFLIDLSALEGLTRALSFVGLGIALLVIGFVYQRLVARPQASTGEG